MNDDRMQILRMVQEGKLSPEEASKLLEAVEQHNVKKPGPPPTKVRLVIREGAKMRQIVVGIGVAQWLLKLPALFVVELGPDQKRFDAGMLLAAIENGAVGKIFEADEGPNHVEVWLDA